MAHDPSKARRQRRKKRDDKIRARFSELHDGQRLRYDDTVTQLADEYCLAESTIAAILNHRYYNDNAN